MCESTIDKALLEDPEAEALAHAFLYLEGADKRAMERYMYHLAHRYFPEGRFEAKRHPVNIDGLNIEHGI